MQLRLILALTAALSAACNGDDDPSGGTTTGNGGGPMTMTLTTMTSLTTEGQTNGDTADSTGDTTAAVDDTAGTSTGEPLPVCPGACVEMAPTGWSGPVATIDSDPLEDAPDCPEAFATAAVEAFDGFAFEPASCDCDCGEAEGAVCDPIGTVRNHGSVENCAGAVVDTINLSAGACVTVPVGGSSFARLEPVELLTLGTCQPIEANVFPDPTFETRVTACEAEVMAGFSCDEMEGMGCVAESPEEPLAPQMCIWREGEHDCPEDSGYVEDRTLHNDFVDERGCTECTCDDPVGVCDNATATLYSSANCSAGLAALMTGEGFCTSVSVSTTTARYLPGTATAFCPAAEVEPTGEVTPEQPITVCCTE